MKIKDVMNKKLVSIDGEKKVIDACKLMGKRHIGSVIVTLKNRPYGIFTERDLLTKILAKGLDTKTALIKKFTAKPLVTVDENYNVSECARIMSELNIRRLIVTSKGRIKGIFTASDLVLVISEFPLDF